MSPTGFSGERIGDILGRKGEGENLVTQGGVPGGLEDLLKATFCYRLARPVVVDLTDESSNGALLIGAMALGADVVTANKGPRRLCWTPSFNS